MSEPLQIMSGFKDIKARFRAKCEILKPASNLALWFSFSNNMLYVHDLEEHRVCMALAIRMPAEPREWKILLPEHSQGYIVLTMAILKNTDRPNYFLNLEYKLLGFIPHRFLK